MTSTKRDPLAYVRSFARRNPEDDGFTPGLVQSLAKLFPRAELTAAERTLASRKPSRSQARQLDLVRRARRITYLPLNRRWT